MTLDEYLKSGRKTAEAVAELAGLTEASISRIRRGRQKPSFDAIRGIVEATDGKVQADDLLNFRPTPTQQETPNQDIAA